MVGFILSNVAFLEHHLLLFDEFYSHVLHFFLKKLCLCALGFRVFIFYFCELLVVIVIGIFGFVLSTITFSEHPLLAFVEFYLHMLHILKIFMCLCYRI